MFELEIRGSNAEGKEEKGFVSERLGLFRKIIESLADIVEQMEIKATHKGLVIQVMDSMHVALADVFLAKELFSSYRCDRDVHLGIPTKQFLAILRGVSPSESSTIRFTSDDAPQTLTIQHILDDFEYTFDVTLYRISSESYVVPQLEYSSSIRIPSEQFRNISKLVGSFGEYIQFKCDKNEFFINQTADLTKNTVQMKSNGTSLCIDSTEPVTVEAAMKYINIINKICGLGSELIINLSSSAPIYFDTRLADQLGYIRFYIAPKINE